MTRFNNPLSNVRVAAPCNADWEQMFGNERARFCGQCNLNVYNLSSMTRSEAEHLIASNEGRLCVRFYRRADGSILTKNCPVGLRAIQRRVSRLTKAIVSAVLSFFAGVGIYQGVSSLSKVDRFPRRTMGVIAVRPAEVMVPLDISLPPPTPPGNKPLPLMGKIRIQHENSARDGIGSREKTAPASRQ
jgi:hypothetical protein